MAENDEALEGTVIEPANSVKNAKNLDDLSPREAFDMLKELVGVVGSIIGASKDHGTRRRQIQAYETTKVAQAKELSLFLDGYFEREYKSRDVFYGGVFKGIHKALDDGNNEALHTLVTAAVDVAKASPLAAVGNLENVRAMFEDPKAVYEL